MPVPDNRERERFSCVRDSEKGEATPKEVMLNESKVEQIRLSNRSAIGRGAPSGQQETSAVASDPAEELAREIHKSVCEGMVSHDCEPETDALAALLRTRWGERRIAAAYAEGRLYEFQLIKSQRSLDPAYWDMHHEKDLQEAFKTLSYPAAAPPREGE